MDIRTILGKLSPAVTNVRRVANYVSQTQGLIRVLMYHDISPSKMTRFRNHMTFLKEHYTFIDHEIFIEMMQGTRPIKGMNLLLTFDDGFKSNYVAAKTILDELGIKAVFFITPAFIDCQTRSEVTEFVANNLFSALYRPDEVSVHMEPMSWGEIDELFLDGHCIGAHTLTHPSLAQITDMEFLRKEVIGSGDLLQEKLGTTIDFFAYPFGKVDYVNANFFEIAGKRYRYLFSGVRGFNSPSVSPMAVRRDDISLNETTSYLKFIIEGGLSLYHREDRDALDKFVQQVKLK